jgi:hypothetical protein
MKKFYSIICVFAFCGSNMYSQNVIIPDANFKAALVANNSINTNADTEIQLTEASNFGGVINVHLLGINDLTGIEAFTALTVLDCSLNSLTNLDLSSNIALVNLDCSSNSLTTLNVSSSQALTNFTCSYNNLTSLDISGDTLLYTFYCNDNQITSLDVSLVADLNFLDCHNNQLTSLNLKNHHNTIMHDLYAFSNPNLYCIDVNDPVNAYFYPLWFKDSTAIYSADCSTMGLEESSNEINPSMDIYPNPATNEFTMRLNSELENRKMEIYNLMGEVILTQKLYSYLQMIDINQFSPGVYIIKVNDLNKTYTKKLIIE